MFCLKKKSKFRFHLYICSVLWLSLVSVPENASQLYYPGEWETIIENQDFETTLSLHEGDDNILIIGSTFHDIDGDAITLRNVSNIYIKDCIIYNVKGNGIVLRSTGKTDKVTIDGCTIYDTTKNGIIAKQNYADDINHTRLVIKNNTLYNNGSDDFDHSIYVQTQDSKILNNEIHGSAGNGISIRSSGVVSGNQIWDTYKSCIRYFSDNVKGPSNTLLIENNVCYLTLPGSQSPALSLLWSDNTSSDWLVDNYIIRFNTIALFTEQRIGIAVESNQLDAKNVLVYGNIVINTQNINATIGQDYIDYLSSNYLSTSLDGFVNLQQRPYNFNLTTLSPALNYAINEIDYPFTDINGVFRPTEHLDAGAYQLERDTVSKVQPTSLSEEASLSIEIAGLASNALEALIGIWILVLVSMLIYIIKKRRIGA